VTQAAGLSLRWIRDLLGGGARDLSYEQLTEEAGLAPPGSDGVLWGPYLMGERTPHLDPNIRAGLTGLAAGHTRSHVIRAVMEGVAFSLRDTLGIFSELKVPVSRIRLGGGGARSQLWRQIQADIYHQAVETVAVEEGAAYGAAILAGVGARHWASVDDACDEVIQPSQTTSCNAAVAALMDQRYREYTRLYPALQTLYRETEELHAKPIHASS
jgi:xylulokinase